MAFESRNKATIYKSKDGDTLEKIAEKVGVTKKELSEFNWNTDDDKEINHFLRDELGARRRNDKNDYILQHDDKVRVPLLIPQRFKREGLSFNKTYTIKVELKKTPPPQLIACHSISGTWFDFNKSFLFPQAADTLQSLNKYAKREECKIMLFGHTDDTGDVQDNKALSLRRAQAVYAALTGNSGLWEKNAFREQWGLAYYQVMLAYLGSDFDPGNTWGGETPENQQAITKFQQANSLAVNGELDDNTKNTIIKQYLSQLVPEKLADNNFAKPKVMGCASFNPIAEVKGKHVDNRRVTVYVFHEQRIPNFPCRALDPLVCKTQIFPGDKRFANGFACSFYDSLGEECACDGQSQRVAQNICQWNELSVSCSHHRVLNVITGKPTHKGNYLLQVISEKPDQENITAKIHSQCLKDKAEACGIVEVKFAGKHKPLSNAEKFLLKAPNVTRSDIKFLDFISSYLIPLPMNLDPEIYELQAKNCDGKLKRKITIEVFPKIKWGGHVAFGYAEPKSFSKSVNDRVGLDKITNQGRWTLEGNIELELGEYKYQYGMKAKEPEESYFPELKKTINQIVSFFSDIKNEIKSQSHGEEDLEIKWPNVKIEGNVQLAESKKTYKVGVEGNVSLTMKPLLSGEVKVDILKWIVRVASLDYGEFINKVREAAEKGLVTSQLEGKAVIGIYLITKGGVSGELAWKKSVDDAWLDTSGDKTATISANYGIRLEGKVEVKGKIFFVSFGMGATMSLEGSTAKYDTVGIVGEIKAEIKNGSPALGGSLIFTGAAIYYTYYAEVSVKIIESKSHNKSSGRSRGGGDEESDEENAKAKKDEKYKLVTIFRERKWPYSNSNVVNINEVNF